MDIRRVGNYGIIDTGNNFYSFSIGAMGKGWTPSSIQLNRGVWFSKRISVNGTFIIPMGMNNDLPGETMRLLDHFYAGEGIMGKITGLQWGEGPRFYEDAIDSTNNKFYRKWILDNIISSDMEAWDYFTFVHRCLVDLTHMQGFFVKFVRNRGPRADQPGKIVRLEHIPYQKARLEYPPDGEDDPQHIIVGDWPWPDPELMVSYPIFDPLHPFKYPVSAKYYNIYSFAKDFMSTPRFLGAMAWLELAGGIAPILASYNANSSAISLHIESPQSYWDKAEERIKAVCARNGEKYSAKMIEDYKDAALETFAQNITGQKNVGKFMHTTKFWNEEANNFDGWKVNPIDKKIKDYIDAQISIANKADTAATSGFGLDPVLANLIIDNKLSSGSEKLYSIKVYNASETAIPDMILCKPLMQYIHANWPGSNTRIGLYRTSVDAESAVSPNNRLKANE
jgi:hypothetical protein